MYARSHSLSLSPVCSLVRLLIHLIQIHKPVNSTSNQISMRYCTCNGTKGKDRLMYIYAHAFYVVSDVMNERCIYIVQQGNNWKCGNKRGYEIKHQPTQASHHISFANTKTFDNNTNRTHTFNQILSRSSQFIDLAEIFEMCGRCPLRSTSTNFEFSMKFNGTLKKDDEEMPH